MAQSMRSRQDKKNRIAQRFNVCVLQVFILLSCLGLIYSKHLARLTFNQLQVAYQTRDRLNSEWTQLLLEQSVWAQEARIESHARRDLNMSPARPDQIVMVNS